MAEERHRPFSCGSQFGDWQNSNCCRCTKFNPEGLGDCEIDKALLHAMFEDGSVSTEIAERMGYLDNSPPRQDGFSYNWQCKEVDWTQEWREEFADNAGERETLVLEGMQIPA